MYPSDEGYTDEDPNSPLSERPQRTHAGRRTTVTSYQSTMMVVRSVRDREGAFSFCPLRAWVNSEANAGSQNSHTRSWRRCLGPDLRSCRPGSRRS